MSSRISEVEGEKSNLKNKLRVEEEKVESLQEEINNLNLHYQEETDRHKQDLEMKIRFETYS